MEYLKQMKITNAIKYVDNKIKEYRLNVEIKDKLILELIKYYPFEKLTNIEWVKRQRTKPFNTISLHYKMNGKINHLKIEHCIRNYFGIFDLKKYKLDKIKKTFRQESNFGTKLEYFNNNISKKKCTHCKQRFNKLTIDHYSIPYIQIFQEFLECNSFKLEDIEIYENEKKELRLKDNELCKNWLSFHDNRSTYRLLCKSCNSHFNSYGYSKKSVAL